MIIGNSKSKHVGASDTVHPSASRSDTGYCRVGGDTFTPERYRLELYSVHTFTRSRALDPFPKENDPHTVSSMAFYKKTTHTQFRVGVEARICRVIARICKELKLESVRARTESIVSPCEL